MDPLPHTPVRSPTPVSSSVEEPDKAPSTDIFPTPRAKEGMSPMRPKRVAPARAASTPPEIMSDSRIRPMRPGPPAGLPSMTSLPRIWNRQQLSKKRSQYYLDAFATREPNMTPKDRVSRDSVIIADLKLSGALDENTTLVSDFSFHLAQVYQRPESSILLTIQDSAVLAFGGSCDPAYLLSITALASDIAPTKNKRTTALMQEFLGELLGVPANRGVVRYMTVSEENLGTNGVTTLAEIEDLERATSIDKSTLRSMSRTQHRKGRKNSFTPLLERTKTPTTNLTPPLSTQGMTDGLGFVKNIDSDNGDERKKVRRGKSFLSFFGVKM